MARRQKRPAKRLTPKEAESIARIIRGALEGESIDQTDSVGIFIYAIARSLREIKMAPSERDPTLYTITRMLERVAGRPVHA
jgi:hypothetical protein